MLHFLLFQCNYSSNHGFATVIGLSENDYHLSSDEMRLDLYSMQLIIFIPFSRVVDGDFLIKISSFRRLAFHVTIAGCYITRKKHML